MTTAETPYLSRDVSKVKIKKNFMQKKKEEKPVHSIARERSLNMLLENLSEESVQVPTETKASKRYFLPEINRIYTTVRF